MSYIIEVAAPGMPGDDKLAWQALDVLRADEDDGTSKHPILVRLHDVLTSVYPCLSQYRNDDPAIDDCPWSDGPLIGNVGSRTTAFGVRGSEQMAAVLRLLVASATTLGLTVFDAQSGAIHRPDPPKPGDTWYVTVTGVWRGLRKDEVAAKLARAFGRDQAQVRAMLELPRAVVRTGLDKLGALQYSAMLFKLGCNIGMGPETAGVPIDPKGGNRPADLRRLHEAAGQGQAQAQCLLGFLYGRGIDVPQDGAQAVKWFERAASQGDTIAQKALALRYQKGDGVPMSYAWALEWMRKAAEQGDVEAQMNVASRYLTGEGAAPDRAEAARWLRLAAEQGNLEAHYRLGQLLRGDMPGADPVEAAAWLGKAAAQGDAQSQAAYGDMFWIGQGGLPKDLAQAYSWFLRAAGQGEAAAMMRVSVCLEAGLGTAQDAGEALRWCRKAAEAGDDWAQVKLGRHYDDGELLPADRRQAFNWYERAARQDNADAQVRLAALYLEGVGGDGVDGRKEALYWLGKAAVSGDALARDMLARLRGRG